MSDEGFILLKERLELIFPIVRFHSGWNELRYNDIDVSSILLMIEKNNQIEFSWSLSEVAEFYTFFRKSSGQENTNWDYLTIVDVDMNSYLENERKTDEKYLYTIVPEFVKDGLACYGK